MKKIIRILLGYIIAAITMLMIIPFMFVSLFLGKLVYGCRVFLSL
jgi:hypothetical protein